MKQHPSGMHLVVLVDLVCCEDVLGLVQERLPSPLNKIVLQGSHARSDETQLNKTVVREAWGPLDRSDGHGKASHCVPLRPVPL